MIRSFIETAVNPKFQFNLYHQALYLWHVENKRDITCPAMPPYYDTKFFAMIREVKEEGLLNIQTMTSGMWYRVLMENKVTHHLTHSGRELLPVRIETKHPEMDWDRAWSLAVTPGLPSKFLTFIWRMMHDLLPSQVRLFRLKMPRIISDTCSLCHQNLVGNLTHSLLLCPYNDGAGNFLLDKLHQVIPNLLPHQVILLDFDVDQDQQLPAMFMIASILSQIWECRKEKKPCHLNTIRATLEAGVNIMRKSRHHKAAQKLTSLLATT